MPTDINTTKTRLARLLQSATPQKPAAPRSNKLITSLLIITIIGTMLPFQAVVTFFSLSCVTIALLFTIQVARKQLQITKSMAALLVALTVTSAISGCAPTFTFQTQQELIKFAHENKIDIHSIRRFGIFGLGLDDATIATAQASSTIKTIQGAQIDRGYGLISVTVVTIAGKS